MSNNPNTAVTQINSPTAIIPVTPDIPEDEYSKVSAAPEDSSLDNPTNLNQMIFSGNTDEVAAALENLPKALENFDSNLLPENKNRNDYLVNGWLDSLLENINTNPNSVTPEVIDYLFIIINDLDLLDKSGAISKLISRLNKIIVLLLKNNPSQFNQFLEAYSDFLNRNPVNAIYALIGVRGLLDEDGDGKPDYLTEYKNIILAFLVVSHDENTLPIPEANRQVITNELFDLITDDYHENIYNTRLIELLGSNYFRELGIENAYTDNKSRLTERLKALLVRSSSDANDFNKIIEFISSNFPEVLENLQKTNPELFLVQTLETIKVSEDPEQLRDSIRIIRTQLTQEVLNDPENNIETISKYSKVIIDLSVRIGFEDPKFLAVWSSILRLVSVVLRIKPDNIRDQIVSEEDRNKFETTFENVATNYSFEKDSTKSNFYKNVFGLILIPGIYSDIFSHKIHQKIYDSILVRYNNTGEVEYLLSQVNVLETLFKFNNAYYGPYVQDLDNALSDLPMETRLMIMTDRDAFVESDKKEPAYFATSFETLYGILIEDEKTYSAYQTLIFEKEEKENNDIKAKLEVFQNKILSPLSERESTVEKEQDERLKTNRVSAIIIRLRGANYQKRRIERIKNEVVDDVNKNIRVNLEEGVNEFYEFLSVPENLDVLFKGIQNPEVFEFITKIIRYLNSIKSNPDYSSLKPQIELANKLILTNPTLLEVMPQDIQSILIIQWRETIIDFKRNGLKSYRESVKENEEVLGGSISLLAVKKRFERRAVNNQLTNKFIELSDPRSNLNVEIVNIFRSKDKDFYKVVRNIPGFYDVVEDLVLIMKEDDYRLLLPEDAELLDLIMNSQDSMLERAKFRAIEILLKSVSNQDPTALRMLNVILELEEPKEALKYAHKQLVDYVASVLVIIPKEQRAQMFAWASEISNNKNILRGLKTNLDGSQSAAQDVNELVRYATTQNAVNNPEYYRQIKKLDRIKKNIDAQQNTDEKVEEQYAKINSDPNMVQIRLDPVEGAVLLNGEAGMSGAEQDRVEEIIVPAVSQAIEFIDTFKFTTLKGLDRNALRELVILSEKFIDLLFHYINKFETTKLENIKKIIGFIDEFSAELLIINRLAGIQFVEFINTRFSKYSTLLEDQDGTSVKPLFENLQTKLNKNKENSNRMYFLNLLTLSKLMKNGFESLSIKDTNKELFIILDFINSQSDVEKFVTALLNNKDNEIRLKTLIGRLHTLFYFHKNNPRIVNMTAKILEKLLSAMPKDKVKDFYTSATENEMKNQFFENTDRKNNTKLTILGRNTAEVVNRVRKLADVNPVTPTAMPTAA